MSVIQIEHNSEKENQLEYKNNHHLEIEDRSCTKSNNRALAKDVSKYSPCWINI